MAFRWRADYGPVLALFGSLRSSDKKGRGRKQNGDGQTDGRTDKQTDRWTLNTNFEHF